MRPRAALAALVVSPIREPVSNRAAAWFTALAPVGGLLLGLLTGALVFAVRIWTKLPNGQSQPLLPAAAGLATLALVTRARHLAGLATVVDALTSGRTGPLGPGQPSPPGPPGVPGRFPGASRGAVAEAEVASAADTTRPLVALGPSGVAAVVFIPLIQTTALSTAILAHRGTATIIVACLASRLSVTLACTRAHAGPKALTATVTSDLANPTGQRRVVFGAVGVGRALLAVVMTALLAAAVGRFDYDGGGTARAVRALIALSIASAAGLVLRRLLTRRFAAQAEPSVGAVIELTATVAIVAMALTVPGRLGT
jgi:adenosylcobinamide-GDP ribazoletransferase